MVRQQASPRGARRESRRRGDGAELFDVAESRIGHDHETTADAPEYETGTTIVGVTAADAVVMAADRRMSLGGRFTANKRVRKVEQVHPTGALAISGAVGPAQGLADSIRAEASLYESRRGEPMSVPALAKTAGHLVRGLRVTPLLAGVDEDGPRVYELDGSGSVLEDRYAAGGSGLQVAYGVLERRFEPDGDVETATDAAVAAVEAASERDTASGNGVTVATITGDGVSFESWAAGGDDGHRADGDEDYNADGADDGDSDGEVA